MFEWLEGSKKLRISLNKLLQKFLLAFVFTQDVVFVNTEMFYVAEP